ncbi:MAG: DUF3592 domain-containing protein [Planctomycetes bacterium]|nr:DUF3592 domain-containing protein [Planctomycetota bacterium]
MNTAVGVLGLLGFLCAGIAILVWNAGQLRLARESRHWPTVEGRIVQSQIDGNGRYDYSVIYTYTVDDVPYASSQLSFDVFDNPGGWGRPESIVARYPVGSRVTVYVKPDDPSTAILEPEVYSPFFIPLLFGVLFLFFGALGMWCTVRSSPDDAPTHNLLLFRGRATAFLSVTLYAILVLACLESASLDTFAKAFGNRPAGLPTGLFVFALLTLIYLPVPWIFWHSFGVFWHPVPRLVPTPLVWLFCRDADPALRRSSFVCFLGLVYLLAVIAAWAVVATSRGI